MAKRSWFIPAGRDGEIDRDALVERLLDLATTVCTVGGVGVFGVDRREVEPGDYRDAGVFVQYNTFVQARHLEALEEPDEDDTDDPGEEEGEDEVVGQQELDPEPAVLE